MYLSRKIIAFDEGMTVYDNLIEDESAIFINFAMGITITQKTVLSQLAEYLDDLDRNECQEIPDIDFEKMTDMKYLLKTGKLRKDMEALNNLTIREHIEANFKDILDLKPVDLYDHIVDQTSQMVMMLKQMYVKLQTADPILFEKNFLKLVRRYSWTDQETAYKKWKNEIGILSMDLLQEKQEQAVCEQLNKGIMAYSPKLSKNYMEKVDYAYHRSLLDCDFVETEDYKKAYAHLMRFASRREELIVIDYKKYGKYIFSHFKDFRPEQKLALFELCVTLGMIHHDMATQKPELGKYLATTDDGSLEGSRYFAFARTMIDVLGQDWFMQIRTDKKYNKQWIKQFLTDLMHSEWRDAIADEWMKSDRHLMIICAMIGALREAGVIKCRYRSVALKLKLGQVKVDTMERYMGEGKKQPYFEWICNYVKG